MAFLRGGAQRGLIPARAGKTESSRSDECDNKAHPRAGGENPLVLRFVR